MEEKNDLKQDSTYPFPLYSPPTEILRFTPWASALEYIVCHADMYPQHIFYRNDYLTVIYDGYPKAQIHLLVLPNDLSIKHAGYLLSRIEYFNRLYSFTECLIAHLQRQYPHLTFQAGIHAIPSLSLLHIHVISCDFISKCLKKNAHYNAMTTSFFITLTELKQLLYDPPTINSKNAWHFNLYKKSKTELEALLHNDLICNRCFENFNHSLDSLKRHIASECLAPLPGTHI